MIDTEKKILSMLQSLNDNIPNDVTINLLSDGYVDSFDIVNIVSGLEEEFSIELEPEDIVPENFDSVEKMVQLVLQEKNKNE